MAAGRVATREIRNMGTLGGNLCQETRCLYFNQKHTFQFRDPCFKRGGDKCYFIPKGKNCWAVFMSDLAPALFSLDARIDIVGSEGVRQAAVDELYTHDPLRPISLKRDEIITKIMIPEKTEPNGCGFAKFTMRGGMEFAGVNVAVFLEAEQDRLTCKRARITVGAVSEGPQRAFATESFLKEKRLSDETIEAASGKFPMILKLCPITDIPRGIWRSVSRARPVRPFGMPQRVSAQQGRNKMSSKHQKRLLELSVNGEVYELAVACQETLLEVLRNRLGFTGTKEGCGTGECGSCTVLLEGEPVLSCLLLAVDCENKRIETIEGQSLEGRTDPGSAGIP
jgi:xanthine dehydrogenase iron-sulfur cluster and FAD-binding subunit A